MKVEKQTQFEPIVITLETKEEACLVRTLVGGLNVIMLHENCSPPISEMTARRIFDKIISPLFNELEKLGVSRLA